MYLSEFRIYGYKSFLDSGPIKLKPGFNILTGQNNAGKTALLEGLSLDFQNKPHQSLSTVPAPGARPKNHSYALFHIGMATQDLKELLIQDPSLKAMIAIRRRKYTDYMQAWGEISSQKEIELEVAYTTAGSPQDPSRNSRLKAPQAILSSHTPESEFLFLTLSSENNKIQPGSTIRPTPTTAQATFSATSHLAHKLISGIYIFRAERMNIGRSRFGTANALEPNARNLPEVLNVLQSENPARFRRYNMLVKRVFQQVEWVNTRPIDANTIEIFVWSISPDTERSDLAIALSECGTGISQVLAMLYVLVTAESPRTILIDEPNSFLHPGAVRALVEILREHPQHQYIVTTHSPELISASNPSTVHVLSRTQEQTRIESIDTREARHLRSLLLEIGSRFSDVFGAEHVLWVEGPTEQLCYPLIVRHLLKTSLAGVAIVGVLHTGDFDAKTDTRSVFRIYERLTQGSALLPPAVAFIFDRELRPEREIEDLKRHSKGKVHFLGRRTYENYLLHADAITAVLNENPPFAEEPVQAKAVKEWLETHHSDQKYYGKIKEPKHLQDVDAPKLLSDLFSDLSGARLAYNKVDHSVALTEWLLEHAPVELQELADILSRVLPVLP